MRKCPQPLQHPRSPLVLGRWSARLLHRLSSSLFSLFPTRKANLGPARILWNDLCNCPSFPRHSRVQNRGFRGDRVNCALVSGDVRRRGEGSEAETALYQCRAILGWSPPRRSPRKSCPGRTHPGASCKAGDGDARRAPP
jgi:hypothetical protein